jgi:hypothetical protein
VLVRRPKRSRGVLIVYSSVKRCDCTCVESAALSVVEGLKVESCKLGASGKMKFRFSLMIYFGAAKIGGFSFSR